MRKRELLILLVGLALAVPSPGAHAEAVTFRLQAPAARSVLLAGSFSAWQARHALRRAANGSWSIVLDLPPGRYEYLYVVDGRWQLDRAALSLADGLGGRNNIVTVAAPR